MKNLKKIFFNLQRFAVIKGTQGHDYLQTEVENTVVYGYAGNDTLKNMFNNVTLSGGDGTDSLVSGNRIYHYGNPNHGISRETITSGISMSGGIGNDYLDIDGSNSTLNGDDGNDRIWSYQHGNNILNGGEGHDSISNWSGINSSLIGGNGKDTLYNSGRNSTMLGGNGNDSIGNDAAYAFIDGGDNNDDIWTHSGSGVTLTGGTGNDNIWIRDNSSGSVVGGSGDDTIYALEHTANITLAGGTGNDMVSLTGDVTAEILYTPGDGNDTIYGLDENDILYIAGSYSTVKTDDNGIIVKVGSDKIVLNNALGKSIDIEKVSSFPDDGDYSGGLNETELTAGKNFTGKEIDLTDHPTVEKLNASAVKHALKITGNKLDNYIQSGSGKDTITGGAGADSLQGGKGNDSLSGGAGKDVFIYANGDGKDIITDYTAGQDKIQITSGKISKATVSGKNVIFTVGKGTITVRNGKGKKITIIDADGNTTTKSYTKTTNFTTSKLWFTEENNFVSNDNLSSITENNLTPTSLEKITTSNFENLTQENNFVTYSSEK